MKPKLFNERLSGRTFATSYCMRKRQTFYAHYASLQCSQKKCNQQTSFIWGKKGLIGGIDH